MPTQCVPVNRCGTSAPGWLTGGHPSVGQGAVQRRVCFHWSGSCCRWSLNIRVQNCGAFFVYELSRPPTCNLRFCGDSGLGKGNVLTSLDCGKILGMATNYYSYLGTISWRNGRVAIEYCCLTLGHARGHTIFSNTIFHLYLAILVHVNIPFRRILRQVWR